MKLSNFMSFPVKTLYGEFSHFQKCSKQSEIFAESRQIIENNNSITITIVLHWGPVVLIHHRTPVEN